MKGVGGPNMQWRKTVSSRFRVSVTVERTKLQMTTERMADTDLRHRGGESETSTSSVTSSSSARRSHGEGNDSLVYHRKKSSQHNCCRFLVICCELGLITILSQHQGTTKIVPLATVVFWPKCWVVAKVLCYQTQRLWTCCATVVKLGINY